MEKALWYLLAGTRGGKNRALLSLRALQLFALGFLTYVTMR